MPDWRHIVRHRLADLNLTAPAEADFVEEIAAHLEDRYRELTAEGAAAEEAYRRVAVELGAVHPLRAAIRTGDWLPRQDAVPSGDVKLGGYFDGLGRDLRSAVRSMGRSPVSFVVLTLALGMGANTTVFTVLNRLILNPLPVRSPGDMAGVAGAEAASSGVGTPFPISYPDLKDYQAQNAVFDSLAGYTSPRVVTRQEGGASEVLFSELVTGNYFATLGLAPAAGRFFAPEEDVPGGPAVAVINYATWQTRFGAAPDIVGRRVRLNNVVFTVIGVAPRGFIGVN